MSLTGEMNFDSNLCHSLPWPHHNTCQVFCFFIHGMGRLILTFLVVNCISNQSVLIVWVNSIRKSHSDSCEQKHDPLEILDRVDINATAERPLSAIKKLLKDSKGGDVSFSKEELKAVEDRMKLVLKEFYRKLRHLKQYSFMNLSAFLKIMKKYEKVTSRFAAKSYMQIVDESYIGNSDEVNALLVKVEDLFSKHFFDANRREAMKLLRHKTKREKQSVTFLSGFFTGCAIALLTAIVLVVQARRFFTEIRPSYKKL